MVKRKNEIMNWEEACEERRRFRGRNKCAAAAGRGWGPHPVNRISNDGHLDFFTDALIEAIDFSSLLFSFLFSSFNTTPLTVIETSSVQSC